MEELQPLLLLITSGLLLRFSLTLTGQEWAKSHSQTVAFLILPVITYVITKTITGNIALSLGMIGALSIVRFRHPVKSALELIIYFDLITIGIATSVRTKWAIQLVLCSVIIIFSVKLVQKIFKKFGHSFYKISFNEGATINTVEVFSNEQIDILENNKNLSNFLNDKETNEYVYRLNFENSKQAHELKKQIKDLKGIKKINIDLI